MLSKKKFITVRSCLVYRTYITTIDRIIINVISKLYYESILDLYLVDKIIIWLKYNIIILD